VFYFAAATALATDAAIAFTLFLGCFSSCFDVLPFRQDGDDYF
jgi:hypothetical protein